MTEPPQQPYPYGQQPPGFEGGYANQGGTGEPPPPKSKAGLITAVVVGAVLLLGGAGTGIYFLTKDSEPTNTANTTSQSKAPQTAKPPSPGPTTSGSSTPTTSGKPPTGSQPPTSGGGGGGGGGDDAQIVQIAEKYAKAVTSKDEAAAKSVTCDNDTGLLYASAKKVEVVGKPETFGDDTASVPVKISIGASDPIENFPLFMDKKDNRWCISS